MNSKLVVPRKEEPQRIAVIRRVGINFRAIDVVKDPAEAGLIPPDCQLGVGLLFRVGDYIGQTELEKMKIIPKPKEVL